MDAGNSLCFNEEGYARIRTSPDNPWNVAATTAVLAGLAMLAAALLAPLKRTDVVPVVNRRTNEAHIESQLAG